MVSLFSRLRRTAGLLLCVAGVLAVAASPAYAHYVYAYHGSDLGTVNGTHTGSSACDRENDGHAVYTDLLLANGVRTQVWDGYDSVCSTRYFKVAIRHFRVCEHTVSCTAWRSA
jgi:hypothetical protein